MAEPAIRRRPLALPAQRARRDESLRGRRVRAQQRGRPLPEPDVPLPADRRPLRRVRASRRSRLPGAHRPDELRRPRQRPDHVGRPGPASRAPVQLPVHRPGPARVGGGHLGRARDPAAACPGSVQRRRAVARPAGPDARAGPGLGPAGRGDGAAPVLHRGHGHRADGGHGSGQHARARNRRIASRRRLGVPLRHQRQHLRAGDDDRGEGRGPDPGPHSVAPGCRGVLPARSCTLGG
jgi:hypothetical protein